MDIFFISWFLLCGLSVWFSVNRLTIKYKKRTGKDPFRYFWVFFSIPDDITIEEKKLFRLYIGSLVGWFVGGGLVVLFHLLMG